LQGAPQITALRELLRADKQADIGLPKSIFYQERRLRAPLRSLVPDPDVGESAARLLALI
jgi:hypothetical protein